MEDNCQDDGELPKRLKLEDQFIEDKPRPSQIGPGLLDLSDDVLLIILAYLSPSDLINLSQSCGRLWCVTRDRTLWAHVDCRENFLDVDVFEETYLEYLLPGTTFLAVDFRLKTLRKQGRKLRPTNTQGRFTFDLLKQITAICIRLDTLILEDICFDAQQIPYAQFPATLRYLSLRSSNVKNLPLRVSYFNDIQRITPNLQVLILSHSLWLESHSLMAISKCPKLSELRLQGCYALGDCIAYFSIATRFGFKTLETLDLRGTQVGDPEVSCLNLVPTLRHLYLESITRYARRRDAEYYMNRVRQYPDITIIPHPDVVGPVQNPVILLQRIDGEMVARNVTNEYHNLNLPRLRGNLRSFAPTGEGSFAEAVPRLTHAHVADGSDSSQPCTSRASAPGRADVLPALIEYASHWSSNQMRDRPSTSRDDVSPTSTFMERLRLQWQHQTDTSEASRNSAERSLLRVPTPLRADDQPIVVVPFHRPAAVGSEDPSLLITPGGSTSNGPSQENASVNVTGAFHHYSALENALRLRGVITLLHDNIFANRSCQTDADGGNSANNADNASSTSGTSNEGPAGSINAESESNDLDHSEQHSLSGASLEVPDDSADPDGASEPDISEDYFAAIRRPASGKSEIPATKLSEHCSAGEKGDSERSNKGSNNIECVMEENIESMHCSDEDQSVDGFSKRKLCPTSTASHMNYESDYKTCGEQDTDYMSCTDYVVKDNQDADAGPNIDGKSRIQEKNGARSLDDVMDDVNSNCSTKDSCGKKKCTSSEELRNYSNCDTKWAPTFQLAVERPHQSPNGEGSSNSFVMGVSFPDSANEGDCDRDTGDEGDESNTNDRRRFKKPLYHKKVKQSSKANASGSRKKYMHNIADDENDASEEGSDVPEDEFQKYLSVTNRIDRLNRKLTALKNEARRKMSGSLPSKNQNWPKDQDSEFSSENVPGCSKEESAKKRKANSPAKEAPSRSFLDSSSSMPSCSKFDPQHHKSRSERTKRNILGPSCSTSDTKKCKVPQGGRSNSRMMFRLKPRSNENDEGNYSSEGDGNSDTSSNRRDRGERRRDGMRLTDSDDSDFSDSEDNGAGRPNLVSRQHFCTIGRTHFSGLSMPFFQRVPQITNTCIHAICSGKSAFVRQIGHNILTLRANPKEPAHECRLETLVLRHFHKITDQSLYALSKITSLRYLDVTGTNVTVYGIKNFKLMRPDVEVSSDHDVPIEP